MLSLTSFIKKNDVKKRFRREIEKPKMKLQWKLLAPPITSHYALVGTAFDYLLRFYVKRLNPDAHEGVWVAEIATRLLAPKRINGALVIPYDAFEDPDLYEKAREAVENARRLQGYFMKDGEITDELIKSAIRLAKLDSVYRSGRTDIELDVIDEGDVEDLRNLISIVDPSMFKAEKTCVLNPTFGYASMLVGGADCDLVIDNAIIEVKTTKYPKLKEDYLHQLVGYYILYLLDGIYVTGAETRIECEIERVGIYFSRHGRLLLIDIDDLINKDTFVDFVEWFAWRAYEPETYGELSLSQILLHAEEEFIRWFVETVGRGLWKRRFKT